jgi:FkbM family methyltransferase
MKDSLKSRVKQFIPLEYRERFWARRYGFSQWVRGKRGKQYDMKKDIRLADVGLIGGEKYGGQRIYMKDLRTKKEPVVFSFGIGEDVSFDKDIINRLGAKVYAFDPTPRAAEYINAQDFPKSKFEFYQYALSSEDGSLDFGIPSDDKSEPSGSLHKNVAELTISRTIKVKAKKLSTIMKELNINHLDLLKMDIEGSEYEVIDDFLDDKIFPDQICLEFHERFFPDGKEKMARAIDKLHENGYKVFALSPMRWEVSLLRAKPKE